ncbi:MAG: PaaX family transcriptional regulator [Beutenbergiaceae bacterium]
MSTTWAVTPRTVIEAFLPADGGPVGLAGMYAAANAVGVADQPLRLAIRRMVGAGELTQSGRGRGGQLTATPAGRARLHRDRVALRLAFAQDDGLAPWDGRWRLLALSTPESERAIRDSLRRQLRDLGAASLATSLYLSPHALAGLLGAESEGRLVQAVADDLDVRGLTDPRAITEALWPAGPVTAAYADLDRLLTQMGAAPAEPADVHAVLAGQLRLAHGLEQAIREDPLIPPELRAGSWEPTRIRSSWCAAWVRLEALLPQPLLHRGWLPGSARTRSGCQSQPQTQQQGQHHQSDQGHGAGGQ